MVRGGRGCAVALRNDVYSGQNDESPGTTICEEYRTAVELSKTLEVFPLPKDDASSSAFRKDTSTTLHSSGCYGNDIRHASHQTSPAVKGSSMHTIW